MSVNIWNKVYHKSWILSRFLEFILMLLDGINACRLCFPLLPPSSAVFTLLLHFLHRQYVCPTFVFQLVGFRWRLCSCRVFFPFCPFNRKRLSSEENRRPSQETLNKCQRQVVVNSQVLTRRWSERKTSLSTSLFTHRTYVFFLSL